MNCPICAIELKLADRQGVEIDYCPKCRGVWLDRGELDKIIERSTGTPQAAPPNQGYYDERHYEDHHHDDHHREHGYGDHHDGHKYGKRRGFLGDIFDF